MHREKCHGLAPWSLMFAATRFPQPRCPDATGLPRGVSCLPLHDFPNQGVRMPRACPVESHVCRYTISPTKVSGCHGLAPWSLMFAATRFPQPRCPDATGLPRGVSCLLLHDFPNQGVRMPRACPVESHVCCY